jgi:hypothetical protein
MFPMVKPPDTEDGLGIIVLNSNAETHFSFTNALGMVSSEQAEAVKASLISTPVPTGSSRSTITSWSIRSRRRSYRSVSAPR